MYRLTTTSSGLFLAKLKFIAYILASTFWFRHFYPIIYLGFAIFNLPGYIVLITANSLKFLIKNYKLVAMIITGLLIFRRYYYHAIYSFLWWWWQISILIFLDIILGAIAMAYINISF